jgi:hypothetical protein
MELFYIGVTLDTFGLENKELFYSRVLLETSGLCVWKKHGISWVFS